MSKHNPLRFSDGMSIDVSGPNRLVRKADGLYVVGNGWYTPVETEEEGAAALVRELMATESLHGCHHQARLSGP